MNRIGIYGGSFDPIHLGHLIIAQTFVEQCFLDKCYLVPTKVSPFKTDSVSFFSDVDRLKMLELSIANNPKFELSTFEINNPEVSYTINTVNHFKHNFPTSELYMLIGFDQAINFDKWKDYEKIRALAKVVVAQRYSLSEPGQNNLKTNFEFILLDNPLIEISSTLIRDKIKAKKSIRYLVTDEVWNYIYRE